VDNNPIGCDALLILRYYLAETSSRIPYAAILSAAHVANMLDPFEGPRVTALEIDLTGNPFAHCADFESQGKRGTTN
jgi:hypothetical protein